MEVKNKINQEILNKGCPNCKGNLEYVGYNKFKCKKCGLFKRPIKKQKNLLNSRNWKDECDECGGIMDYYNYKYCCRKCGNVKEV